MKTYTGGQGYVYQYYFVGKRPSPATDKPATEFIFDVTSDRKTTFSVSVFLRDDAVAAWAAAHGRALTDAEQYGGGKKRPFQGFYQMEEIMGNGKALYLYFE